MIHAIDRKSVAGIKAAMHHKFLEQKPLNTGEWQSQDISDKPMLATREVQNVSLCITLPDSPHQLAIETACNLPWAEDHFQERVSGEPLNPPPSEAWWPYAQKNNAEHKSQGEKFSHTYPERMWPKFAPAGEPRKGGITSATMPGIRFAYGDLDDVVQQLKRGPLTRQAYLPIWFPEDTGAVHSERVPCTLGYHFLIRGGKLTITYYIRSCDFIRHFSDDVYMAGRLAQWMVAELNEDANILAGEEYSVKELIMHIASFHIFEGDVTEVERRIKAAQAAESSRLMGLL